MKIKDIRLINFRNYFNLNITLNEKLNILIGQNAQGKTNFLESIYMCGTGRTFRANNEKDIINLSKKQAYVGANIKIDNFNRFIEVKLDRDNPKTMRINKNPIENNKELSSGLNVVVFSPDDLSLIKEGPSKRRDYLNREIYQINPLYNYNLRKYEKVLYQRNNILKSNRPDREKKDLLEVFDLQLVKYGVYLIKERIIYIEKLNIIANNIHKKITESKEDLFIEYSCNVENSKDLSYLEKTYLEKLILNREKDIFNRTTSMGPHRDDMIISVNGNDLRTFGSQGQQRTTVLSMKLSEVELIKTEMGTYPILLLDDVFSELDKSRRKYLIESLKNIQTIITVTDAIDIRELRDIEKTIFTVKNGFFKIEEEGIIDDY